MTLANAFTREIRAALTVEQLQEVNRRNRLPEYSLNACATHDFCDANIYMHDAFVATMGREPDFNNEGDCETINGAWDAARFSGFGGLSDAF